ncbi:terminase small subunit [Mycobacterium phage Nairb]|uniref:Terminase small subunit n=5 Tax=Bernalvirus bernal13 TaxID=1982102 RepID=A0A2P1JRL8_9CAUD|nr:terminase small subunit [Mycobacterium phage Bernal13]AIT13415.1 terminase small subunit [Mycobacterium phage RonRayGun]ASJ79083.1 terminase small subunit [Mycobacterium phage ZenTime222]AVO21790.1 terminase small subunit [Mycobacterium phage Nairb]QBP28847.1 terminase small subunit [Mycobacterium phage Ibrahim]QHB47408.1 terminase small subunit [Mycobacterium phage Whitty]
MTDTETTKPRRPTKPRDLGKAGSKLWREIAGSGKYELRPDELALLAHACREEDLIDMLEDALKDAPIMVSGSQGQDVINPMISELRQHRATQKTLLAALKLPDEVEDAGGESTRSTNARAAAQSRWGKVG